MREINFNEKLLKRQLKNKRKITLSLIVAFLISDGFGFEEVEARDLRTRKKESNNLVPDYGGPGLNKSANDIDIVNIVDPNSSGISHNKFIDLSVGSGNGLIFNNSTEHGVSQIGGHITKNPNLNKSASVILNEVRGNNISNINGDIEIFGGKADFVLANENGISLNNAIFINTNGVTLSTGAPIINGENINFNVQKGNINLNGVGTSGNYFNIIAKTIELHNQIAPLSKESNTEITLIAGENIVSLDKGNVNILHSKNAESKKYGIYASNLGAMYGKNIKLISTDKGLGVRHEGIIFSDNDILIDSSGDITLSSINAGNNLTLKGINFNAKAGEIIIGNDKYTNSITAKGNVNINIKDKVHINSVIQSLNKNINIKADELVNKGMVFADKNLLIEANSIQNKLGAILKGATLSLKTIVSFINSGEIRENNEINSFVDPDGNIKIEVTLGKFENYGNLSAKKIQVLAQSILNSFNSKIITTNEDIVLITTLGEFINNGDILADKNVSIISKEDIVNTGKIGGNNILIQGLNGEFLNAGYITAIQTLEIIVDGLNNAGSSAEIEKYLDLFQEYSIEYLNKVLETIKLLEEKIKIEADQDKLKGLKEALDHFNILKNRLIELKEELAKTGNLGVLSGENIDIQASKNIVNSGIITTNKNLKLQGDDILNYAVLQGDDIFIKALGNILNSQRIIVTNNLSITGKSFVSLGNSIKIEEYLNLLSTFDENRLTEVDKLIKDLEYQLTIKTNIAAINNIKSQLNNLYTEKQELNNIKFKISTFEGLGVLEGNNIAITTIETLANSGILLSKGDVALKVKGDIYNNGVVTVGNNLTVEGNGFTSNNLTVAGKLKAILNETFTSKNLTVGTDIDIEASKLVLSGNLSSNGKLDLEGDFGTTKDTSTKIKNDINIKGSVNNNGSLITGGNLTVNSGDKNFISNGDIDIKGKANISSNQFQTNGDITIEGSFDLQAKDKLKNTGKFQTKGNMTVKSKGFENIKLIVTEGNLIVNSKDGEFSSKDLSVGSNLLLDSNEIKTNGNTTVGGEAILNTNGGNLSNIGKFHVYKKLSIDTASLKNKGEISSSGLDLNLNGNLENQGSIQSKGNASIKNLEKYSLISSEGDITIDGNLTIDANGSDLVNNGKILASGSLSVKVKDIMNSNNSHIGASENLNIDANSLNNDSSKLIGKGIDIKLNGSSNLGQVIGSDNIIIKGNAGLSIDKLQTPGDITVNTLGNIENKGMTVSNKNISLSGENITNNQGTTIWAGQNVVLNAIKEIYNNLLATIEAKGNMVLTAKAITNNAGIIRSGKDMTLKTDSLINKSSFIDVPLITGKDIVSETVTRWNDILNYHLNYVKLEIPNIVNNMVVKDRANINSRGKLEIEGLSKKASNILNESGTISSNKNMVVYGSVVNKALYKELSIEWLLDNIKVKLHWETKLYLTDAHGNSGISFEGTLREAFSEGHFNGKNSYYESLKLQNDSTLNKVLSSFLGSDWKSHEKPVAQNKWDSSGKFKFYAANVNAQILAGGKLIHSLGLFNNDGGESGGNKNIKVQIGETTIDGTQSNIDVNVRDINSIKEVGGIKYIHDIEIIIGEVIIDGVTIKAETGNTAGVIAVSGTINPIIFIDIPTGENGVFKPASPNPGKIQPLFETNIEFIDPNKLFGTDYFFGQIGYDKDKTTTIIGDTYYEYLLIQKMVKEGIGYAGEIGVDEIKLMLDNAISIQKQLTLEIGKPLTPAQINNLDKDIIWYVEIELNGVKALTPQIYLSKNSRIKLAQSQGSGGLSTVKVGGDIVMNVDSFNNSNGNITANGNIIIKSETDINNNSSGGFGAGITSNNGNIALDANSDINIKGARITGDNVLVSGENVNIESSLTNNSNGDQIIADKAGITANNGIQIDANDGINIKGGSLMASGQEVVPEEKEKSREITEEKEEKKDSLVKDANYYKELFKKESKDIIEGPAGSINVNAGGTVNIEDIYTVSSGSKYNQKDNSNYEKEVWVKAKSNSSNILGSNININAKDGINIKGSNLGTHDVFEKEKKDEATMEKEKKSEYLPGLINLKADNNVKIEDSQDVSYSKLDIKKTSTKSEVIDEKGNIHEVGDTILTVKITQKEKNASISKGSSISTGGDLNIWAGNDLTIQGSQTVALGNTKLEAKNDVNILDGRTTITEKITNSIYQIFGGSHETIKKKSSSSVGSNITGSGNVNIKAGNNMKVVGSKSTSLDGNLNLNAGKNIKIEAGKNEYSEKNEKTTVGFFAEGSVGIAGIGVTGSASTGDMSASGEINGIIGENNIMDNLDGSNEKTPTTSGKPHMDQLANSEVGLKIENLKKKINETSWISSELSGKNINITAGETADIGGGNYSATENIKIIAKDVETTKYKDIRTEETEGFSIAIKQSVGANSAIADAINTGIKMDEAIKSGQANEGILAAQGIGTATNLLFNDMIGSYSKQSANVSYENTFKEDKSENTTKLDAKNISITAIEGNINLSGINANAENELALDAKKNINISSAKSSSKESGIKVDTEAQFEQSAGYSALWGANTDVGIGGSINVDITSKKSSSHTNSQLKSKGNISIKSDGDTNIKGGNVEATKDTNINVGGNLNIESQKSTSKEDSINVNLGGNVSIGAASNTIGKGDFGFNAGGGNIWKDSEIVEQSGIKSGGNLNVKVGGDLNMIGAILGSESGNGNLDVSGNINMKDLTTKEKQGGAHITVSGGLSGDFGVDGTIGDEQNKQITSKSVIGLNPGNISIGGDIDINGETKTNKDINKDMENSQIVDKDIFKKGGDISLSGSIQNVKDIKDKINQVKDKIIGGKNIIKNLEVKKLTNSKNNLLSNKTFVVNPILNKNKNKDVRVEEIYRLQNQKLEESKKSILQENKKNIKENKKVKESNERLSQNRDGKKILTRSSKDIKENLKLVAKNRKNIPIEHLNSFLGDVLINSNEKKLKENNKNNDIILENPDLNHNKKSAENLLSIYNQIYQESDKTKLITYNEIFSSHLKVDENIKELLIKDNVKKEDIQELVKIVGELKSQAFKKEFKKEYDKVNLIIKGADSNKSAELSGNALIIYFDSESNKNMKEYLGTIVHEYTHNDQRNLQKYELLSPKDNLGYLYNLNSSKNGYIEPTSSNKGYKEQPVEKEAFNAQNKILSTAFELEASETTRASINEGNLQISNLKEVEKKLERVKKEGKIKTINILEMNEEVTSKRTYNDSNQKLEEITISKFLKSDVFKENLEVLKNKLKEKYGEEHANTIDEVFNLENSRTKNEIKEYIRKELEEQNLTLFLENSTPFLENLIVKFMEQFEDYKKSFNLEELDGGSKNFVRTSDEIKRQLEIVTKDKNHLLGEHIQNFLANILLDKEAKKIKETSISSPVNLIINDSLLLDSASSINLYSLYEKLPRPFEEGRKKLDDLLIIELGNNDSLKKFIKNSGFTEIDILKKKYKENPQNVINKIYNIDISDIDDIQIQEIFNQVQKAREKNFSNYSASN